MKKIFFCLLLLLPALFCTGQEAVYIETLPNATIYRVPGRLNLSSGKRLRYDYYTNAKKATPGKDNRFLVSGLANYNLAPGYDTYIAQQKGKKYFIPMNVVADNRFIDSVNREISEASLLLADSLDRWQKAHEQAYQDLIALTESGSDACWNRIQGIRQNPDSILDVHVREFMDADVLRYREIRDRYEAWTRTLPPDCRKAAGQLAITRTGLTCSPSGACDYQMEFTNLSPKTIKTLTWTGKLLDAAGNELVCTVRNRPTLSSRFTGPCPPAWPAATVWKNIAYHPQADRIALTSINIVYADGSQYTLDGHVLETLLTLPPEALPAGVHTESHLKGLNQFEIDHNQLLQQKKAAFRGQLSEEERREGQELEQWASLKNELYRTGLQDEGIQTLLSDERFLSLKEKAPLEEAVQNYLETSRSLTRAADRYERFRKENFFEP